MPATAQYQLSKRLRIARAKLVFGGLLDKKANVRKTLLASSPSLELMANIFSPCVRESFP